MIIQNESERKFATDILSSDPDAELRNEVRQLFNGEYAYEICRRCKKYKANLSGNIAIAKIVNVCKHCFNIEKKTYNDSKS